MLRSYFARRLATKQTRTIGGVVEYANYLDRFCSVPSGIVFFPKANLTDDMLSRSVVHFKNLKYLMASETKVTNNGLQALGHFDSLMLLMLAGSLVDAEGFTNAKWLPTLQNLSIRDSQVDDGLWCKIKRSSGLADLSIGGTQIRTLTDIRFFSHLRSLDINSLSLAATEFQHLKNLPQLEKLYANKCSFVSECVSAISTSNSLHTLAIGLSDFGDEDAKMLSNLANLKELHVQDTELSDRGLDDLKSLPKLEQLTICGTDVTPDGIAQLLNFPSLQTVMLDEDVYETASEIVRTRLNGKIITIPRDCLAA